MTKKELVQTGFQKALPVMVSYLFIGMAYGILMGKAGYSWLWTFLISLSVYTGAFQFVLIPFLQEGASLLTIAATALFMNSRQSFYALTFLDDFNKMKKKKLYMIHSLTDESYAVDCSLMKEEQYSDAQRREIMFWCALFSHISWIAASTVGCLFGTVLTFETKGIDFCMTALFVTIFIDQWKSTRNHLPALCGAGIALVLCFLLGTGSFMLPSLALVSAVLLLNRKMGEEKVC
jgi:4-azaleucine resistance transporter AzlC